MKILSIGNFGTGWDGSICDEEHIAQALEELGHEVTRVQREETKKAEWKYSRADFALIAQWDSYYDDLIPRLRYFTKNVVYWAFDYQANGQEWHERLIEGADLYLSKRIADNKYPNWQWLSQDFAPQFLDRNDPLPPYYQDIEVLFTGSYLPWAIERNATLKAVDEKFNLVIHSVNDWPEFKDVRPAIMDDGLPGLYNRAQIVLSIDHTLEAGYWSDRNAQIMCCGARPLFRYVPLSEIRFGTHVDYFYSIEDCLEKIANRTYRENAENSYQYAHTTLKVKNRVQDLLTIVKSIL